MIQFHFHLVPPMSNMFSLLPFPVDSCASSNRDGDKYVGTGQVYNPNSISTDIKSPSITIGATTVQVQDTAPLGGGGTGYAVGDEVFIVRVVAEDVPVNVSILIRHIAVRMYQYTI